MSERTYGVLFLCTGNSARSIMGEAVLNHRGHGRFRAYSTGSYPKGEVHPLTLRVLEELCIPTAGLRSKPWDEFAASGAPVIDFVFTVCDKAAAEACPVWPGRPVSAHWGVPDPAAVAGNEEKRLAVFRQALRALDQRIRLFTSLPFDKLDRMSLKAALQDIGETS